LCIPGEIADKLQTGLGGLQTFVSKLAVAQALPECDLVVSKDNNVVIDFRDCS